MTGTLPFRALREVGESSGPSPVKVHGSCHELGGSVEGVWWELSRVGDSKASSSDGVDGLTTGA